MTGKYWKREKDILALGIGQVVPSKEYIRAGNQGRAEGHLEAYYSFALTDFIFVSPDLQLVWDPAGVSSQTTDPVFVYGLRVHADF
jgi:carbohydrate-selective porin OprB